jgi:hypothetical protein
MKVALRDDDTSYFTEPGRLESVYHDVWDRIPVGLAVIPQAAGFADKAIPEKYWDADRAFPLEENPALVESLRKLVKDASRAGRPTSRGASTRASACSCRRITPCRSAASRRSTPPV